MRRRGRFNPGWRKATWAIVVWSTFCLLLFLAGLVTSWLESGCAGRRLCEDESATDVAFLAIVFAGWLMGFAPLSLVWLVTGPLRARRRRS